MWLTIKLLYTMRYETPIYAFKRFGGYNGKAVLLAVNLGVTDFCGATVGLHPTAANFTNAANMTTPGTYARYACLSFLKDNLEVFR